jgi:HlyD family secretion protein
MNRKYIYVILALTLLSCLVILIFFLGNISEPRATEDIQVERPPFLTYITGTGVVEPVSGNIMISSPLNRIVEKINVSVNDQVKKGEILFQLHDQDLKANLKIKQKRYEESLSNLQKLKALPREEDLIIALRTLNRAQAVFNQAITEYCMAMHCARSTKEKCIYLYKYQQAEADFLVAQAQFEKVRSGAWEPELKIAQDEVEQAKADIEAMEAEIAKASIKSPIDGTVLQINIRKGETLDPNKTALILGNIEELNLRVGIDQLIESRFHPDSPAVAFKQGDHTTDFPLKFLHVEPFMVPKKYLTNSLNERVDTQILEVLYRIEKDNSHLFVGEQMDVYIYVDKK